MTAGMAADMGGSAPREQSGGILLLVERDGGGIADASLRAAGVARLLAEASPAGVTAVLFPADEGAESADVDTASRQLAASGIAGLSVVSHQSLSGYAPVAWARALQQLAESAAASAVVAAATDRASEVLAHLGAMTGLPVAANCVSARPGSPGSWEIVRQRWAGSLLEDAVLEAPRALLTVAADALPPPADPRAGSASVDGRQVTTFTPELTEADLLVSAKVSAEQGSGLTLATARVVVGGGRGVGGPDGFAPLEELAGLLGGVVGVSRVVTSQGWRPHRQQVGQTGTKISPEVYLACGISGAIQHMAGCLSARHIVVINTDADAPIISHAEYAVIGDLSEVVPALVASIRGRAAQA
jgi:electron transfer flavoprotein alpha subunit